MSPLLLKAYWTAFLKSQAGQIASSFLRVFLATLTGCYLQAGVGFDVTADEAKAWIELAVEAGLALVMANYFGPWEKRYGRNKERVVQPQE